MSRILRTALTLIAVVAGSLALIGCQGGANSEAKPAAKKLNFTGFIKGKPAGDSFVVASKSATYTVNMAGSTFERDGAPIKSDDLKDGSFITVTGTAEGKNLTAKKIRLIKDPGQSIEAPVAVSAG